MQEPEIIEPGGKHPPRSWPQAYFAFLRSPHESRILKLMPLVSLGIVPVSMLDDFILPVFGMIDDIPTTIIVVATVVVTYFRVKRYR